MLKAKFTITLGSSRRTMRRLGVAALVVASLVVGNLEVTIYPAMPLSVCSPMPVH